MRTIDLQSAYFKTYPKSVSLIEARAWYTESMCTMKSIASSCWFSEPLRRDLGRVTLVVVVVVVVVVIVIVTYNCLLSITASLLEVCNNAAYLVTVDASDKCKERRAWTTLNLSSASMLLTKSVTDARQSSSGAMSNRNKRGLNTSCTLRWNVTIVITVCFFERYV